MSEASLDLNEISIVHWFKELERHKCGYCKNRTGSASYGMWAETLTVEDYQNLIDRGWRRSGLYCYKPIMDETCCPQYTIRCEAERLSLTKSQKKVIKKFNRYLQDGLLSKNDPSHDPAGDEDYGASVTNYMPDVDASDMTTRCSEIRNRLNDSEPGMKQGNEAPSTSGTLSETMGTTSTEDTSIRTSAENKIVKAKAAVKEGVGADPDRPKCKKAKLIRVERKQQKLTSQGCDTGKFQPKQDANKIKTLEEYLSEISENGKLKLRIELVPTSEPGDEWRRVESIEYELYRKYQTVVHNDKDCSLNGFKRFLVTSPLKPKSFSNCSNSAVGFGSYHQQYWLDDKLIAVGVIDILPKCISSVYFFYDPEYRNLTLGTYGSLRELQYTRQLHDLEPSIQFYYMGYYIHSCPKMRYKGKLVPSYLLCPETYFWIPIEECIPKLDVCKYSRLNCDLDALDTKVCSKRDVDKIKVLADYVCMFYSMYRKQYGRDDMFDNIGQLVGKTAKDLLFVINK